MGHYHYNHHRSYHALPPGTYLCRDLPPFPLHSILPTCSRYHSILYHYSLDFLLPRFPTRCSVAIYIPPAHCFCLLPWVLPRRRAMLQHYIGTTILLDTTTYQFLYLYYLFLHISIPATTLRYTYPTLPATCHSTTYRCLPPHSSCLLFCLFFLPCGLGLQ